MSARATWTTENDQLFRVDGLYPDTNIPYTITFNAMQQLEDYDTIFPLHEDCLHISRRAIDHLEPVAPGAQAVSSLSILNKMLQTRYRHNGTCSRTSDAVARNDLFQLCTATTTSGPRAVVSLSLLEWWAGEYEVRQLCARGIPRLTCAEILYGPGTYTRYHGLCSGFAPGYCCP